MSQSYCNPCSRFRNLPTCLSSLIVGTISGNNNALVYVFIKNWTTGFEQRFEAQLSGAGVLTVDVSSGAWTPQHDYELWVTLQTATNTDERLTFAVNAVNYTCAGFIFENVMSYYTDNNLAYPTQTLKLKS